MCLILLAVTWLPVFGIHLSKTSLNPEDTGTVVAMFAPGTAQKDLFRRVIEARGSIVRPVSWLPGTWVVMSREPGFAGRMQQAGAWGVYAPELLSARALLDCISVEKPAASGRPAG